MPPLVVTEDLVIRIERSRTSQYRERAEWVARIPDNPWKVAWRRFGDATALRWPGYDTVIGLREPDLGSLDAILAWYEAQGTTPGFDLPPIEACRPVADALAGRGFRSIHPHSILCGRTARRTAASPVPIRALGVDELDLFAEAWRACYGNVEDDDEWAQWKPRVIATYGSDRFRRFLIEVDGELAALGISHNPDHHVAYLSNAGTAPQFRGRGFHADLIRERLDCAVRDGFELIAADAAPYLQSQRNLERCGLKIAYQKVRWEKAG